MTSFRYGGRRKQQWKMSVIYGAVGTIHDHKRRKDSPAADDNGSTGYCDVIVISEREQRTRSRVGLCLNDRDSFLYADTALIAKQLSSFSDKGTRYQEGTR